MNTFTPIFTPFDRLRPYVNAWKDERIWEVNNPGYFQFRCPEKERIGVSVIIVPGGAYQKLNPIYNGFQYANILNAYGIDAYVLIHRLPHGNGLADCINDLSKMISIVAEDTPSDESIGLMGCSAGGHLCAMCANRPELDQKIHFCILVSPVISMHSCLIKTEAHQRTKTNAIGRLIEVRPECYKDYSCEYKVTDRHPPTLLLHSQMDSKVSPQQSTLYFNQLNSNGIQCELHIFRLGQHDFKVNQGNWIGITVEWIYELTFKKVKNKIF